MTEVIIGNEFCDKVIPLINNAKNEIDILVYEWNFYPNQPGSAPQKFNQAIIKAQSKGVRIKAMLGRSSISTIQKQNELQILTPAIKTNIHAKLMIIDDKLAILGSHNYSYSAFTTNMEISLLIDDESAILRLKKLFNTIYR